MSEFTSGILYLNQLNEKVKDAFQESDISFVIKELNTKQSSLLLEDAWLENPNTKLAISELSKTVPLMIFQNAEDHGWSYNILLNGKVTSSYECNYELENNLVMELASKKFPDEDVIELLYMGDGTKYQELLAEVKASPEFQKINNSRFDSANLSFFSEFKIGEDKIQRLSELFDSSKQTEGWDMLGEFKKIVGIEEMSWISYDYATNP